MQRPSWFPSLSILPTQACFLICKIELLTTHLLTGRQPHNPTKYHSLPSIPVLKCRPGLQFRRVQTAPSPPTPELEIIVAPPGHPGQLLPGLSGQCSPLLHSHCGKGGLSLGKVDTDQRESNFPFGSEQFHNN